MVCVFQSVEGTPLLTLLKDPYILISAGKETTHLYEDHFPKDTEKNKQLLCFEDVVWVELEQEPAHM